MTTTKKIVALCVAAALLVVAGLFVMRRGGVTGATADYGGALPSRTVPEFTSLDAARWVNGAPAGLEGARGSVVIVEAWHPA
jgi:hypothetical protein